MHKPAVSLPNLWALHLPRLDSPDATRLIYGDNVEISGFKIGKEKSIDGSHQCSCLFRFQIQLFNVADFSKGMAIKMRDHTAVVSLIPLLVRPFEVVFKFISF